MPILFRILLVSFILAGQVHAARITFLPVSVRGEIPEKLKLVQELPLELSLLQSWLLQDLYYAETTGKRELNSYGFPSGKIIRKPSVPEIKKICNESDSDYVIFSEISFGKKNILYSENFNCRNRTGNTKEMIISQNIQAGMKKFVAGQFNFLPAKKREQRVTGQSSGSIIYLIDYSISMNREIYQLKNVLKTNLPSVKTGLFVLKQNTYKYFPPSANTDNAVRYLESGRPAGDLAIKDISAGIQKLEGIADPAAEVIIITDAKPQKSDYIRFPTVIRSLKNRVKSVKLVTGSFFDNQTYNFYKKSARAGGSELVPISHYQKIGTKDGYKYLVLQNMNLYFTTRENFSRPAKPGNMTRLAPGEVFSRTETLRPEMMSGLYQDILKDPVLEKEDIESDLGALLEAGSDTDNGSSMDFMKVMLKVEGSAVWLNMNVDKNLIGSEIVVKTTFVPDKKSSYGFKNLPADTTVIKGDYPLLMLKIPAEISRDMNSRSSIKCLMKGTVLDVR